jgi:hypothetical protein
MVMGDAGGKVHCVRAGYLWSSFVAYSGEVAHTHHLQQRDILVTVGVDGTGQGPILKLWRLRIPVEDGDPPPAVPTPTFKTANAAECVKGGVPLEISGKETATCLRASEDLQFVAVGLSNGATILIRGDIMSGDTRRFIQTKLMPQGSSQAVRALYFQQVTGSQSVLFSVSTTAVSTHRLADGLIEDGDQSEVLDVLDKDNGVDPGCCTQREDGSREILVGTKDAIFRYMYDGADCSPAGLFQFEGGRKKQLMSFNGYLLVVGQCRL